MSHSTDPDTSAAAAERAKRGKKIPAIQAAIVAILGEGPATARELHDEYTFQRTSNGWPSADLQDIRRRLTELKLDQKLVTDSGIRRNGEAVMRLAEEVAS
ncbi:hypothetical protein MN032_17665 [Agromyces atrinae]|uniref:hypothetical protein n=1 Tax=Agromyces atrinae TaxID=592376 RepID=UPI001F562549|nr:hypothetical protein [Agromyces atrinae]MCI2959516.1 hypothetical protein [Agromyces atrinae]